MSHHTRTVLLLLVVIILVIAGWVWYGSTSSPVTSTTAPVTSASDSSDAALQSDLKNVGGQLDAINTDASSIDQSLPQ